MENKKIFGKDFVAVKYQEIVTETDRATLFMINGEEIWLPKSQALVYKVRKEVEMPEWLYDKKFRE